MTRFAQMSNDPIPLLNEGVILWQTNIAVEAALICICILWGLLYTDRLICVKLMSELMSNFLCGVYYLRLYLLRNSAQKGEFSTQGAQVYGVG